MRKIHTQDYLRQIGKTSTRKNKRKFSNLQKEVCIQGQSSWLEWPFEEIEVHAMVRKMVKDKALGPEGFSRASSKFVEMW